MNDPRIQLLVGDCREQLRTLPAESVHCCVTSPPYFGLRDYGVGGQIGLEPTPDAFVAELVSVFREVRRVLRDDGTLWVNLGDSYAQSNARGGTSNGTHSVDPVKGFRSSSRYTESATISAKLCGVKPKDLVGVPWRVAFALQADGWYLRQDIIWHKPNPMPESVRDRCTKAHEYVFLLSKSARYYYDAEAVAEQSDEPWRAGKTERCFGPSNPIGTMRGDVGREVMRTETRNKRSVWTVATAPFPGSHFATFPPALIEPCILAGCPEGGTVLDPFGGSGTTAGVAIKHGRRAILCELNPAYAAMVDERVRSIAEYEFGLFAEAVG